jgi:SAM-dependent methyltransferase
MSIYQEYAPFYDGSGQIRFAVLMSQYLAEVLERHPVDGRRALDIACGTGTLALILADRGWEVVGVDASPTMLAIARSRAQSSDAPEQLLFLQADMRDLAIAGPVDDGGWWTHAGRPWIAAFDLVTCTYDSLNYLLHLDELAACFRGVRRLLRPGGLFVADMNTRYFLEHDWGEHEVLERAGFVQVAQSSFDPANNCSTMILSGFVGDDQRGYQRFEETHIERAYPVEQIAASLAEAGLQIEATYDCFTFEPIQERSQRIAWVVRRKAADAAENR